MNNLAKNWKFPVVVSSAAVVVFLYLRKKKTQTLAVESKKETIPVRTTKKETIPVRTKLNDGTSFDLLVTDPQYASKPKIQTTYSFVDGRIEPWNGKTVEVYSPITCNGERVQIGSQAIMDEKKSLEALDAAVKSWKDGRGEWASLSIDERIPRVEKFVEVLSSKRDEIATYLQWEICKSTKDAYAEFDRTMKYIKNTCESIRNMCRSIKEESGVAALMNRAPLGVVVILGPYNYPFNETYCMLIPALLMGNSVVMKLPNIGSMAHISSMEAFSEHFPGGVVNFVTGSGRVTIPPLMKTGKVDVLGFIGGCKGADSLIKAHPHPHRLTHVLGLDAKNPAIVLEDADLKVAVEQCTLGSCSYNGQRCTALKIIFVHNSLVSDFLAEFNSSVDSLVVGLPWTHGVKITPLAEPKKPGYLEDLIQDAESKGAKVVNKRGGQRAYAILPPTVLYPVNKNMKIWSEEQFGPIIPVVPFDNYEEVLNYMGESKFGQQVSIFGQNKEVVQTLVKSLVNMVARVNINSQCRRSPDTFPFTGRKSSAHGTLSVRDALTIFSLPSVIATPQKYKKILESFDEEA